MKIESGRFLNDYIYPNKKQYCIPVFQRDYAWTAEQCRKLFEDIVLAYKLDRLHFCGSFVYAPLETKNKIDYFIIIDGQQRFTTIYILLKALIDSADNDADKEALRSYLFNEDKFNRYSIDEKSKLKLKPVKTDNDQLMLLMEDKLESMNRTDEGIIYHNYILFKELINGFLNEDPNNSVMMIHDGIDNLICAQISLDQNDDAQEIFERINSTGIQLGLSDLIRNRVLMTDKDQEFLYEEYWLRTQELLSRSGLDAFFKEYLNFKTDGFTKESEAYSVFKRLYQDGNYTNESMLKEILHYARQYHTFSNGNKELCDDINNALLGLKQINQTTVYTFLFRIFDDYENGIIDQKEMAKVIRLLLNYSVRRTVCEIGSNSLRGFYKTLYSRVFNYPENKKHYYDSLVSFMLQLTTKDAIPSDEEFRNALIYRNLYRKNQMCKYLLSTIENQGKEKVIIDNLSIEHIMPQNKNMSPAWRKMLGDNWEQVKDRYLHTLGNLTLTGYNSELGDRPFLDKKKLLEDAGSHITVLYSDVKETDIWNEEAILSRAQRLSSIVLGIYDIEKPTVLVQFIDPTYRLYTVADPENATYKHINYYELLGERVNVDSFALMVRSVAEKIYDLDNSIIDKMARENGTFPEWSSPVFSFDETKIRNPIKLKKDYDVFISTGYSAADCIRFIRALLKKYDLDIEEDFKYSARPTSSKEKEMYKLEISKEWCENASNKGLLYFDKKQSEDRYIRFTTPFMNSVIPLSEDFNSPWKTKNFYFYEITTFKGEFYVQLHVYCQNLSDNMREAIVHLSNILGLGELGKGYKRFFKSISFKNNKKDDRETVFTQLDLIFNEIREFETDVQNKWNKNAC
ncbi:MAG: DUF262 domain-containing protein [Clostridia bacterium]|nr:DUF262 domain-containing protein [Clostridia bacterium]